jgi:hypothetical protein
VSGDLTWAEWLALGLVVVFVLLPVMAWREVSGVCRAAWMRWTGTWIRGERFLDR